MNVPASTVLSFITGRLYSSSAPTVLFGPMLEVATGQTAVYTHQLPRLRDEIGSKILAQCPKEFQKICNDWQHTPDWKQKVELIDESFGGIEIKYCV